MEAVTAVQLTKTYGEVQAVRDLTLHVPQGGVFGLLGAQGAGKTTVIHMLCGLTKPTSGECSVLGCSPAKDPAAVHAVCGVMLASARPYAHMTGQQNLLFFAQAAGMAEKAAERRVSELMKDLELWDERERPVSEYSTGMLQKLSLARALVNYPSVLLLDEPTSGLDPVSRDELLSILAAYIEDGEHSVLFSTHITEDLERAADYITYLRYGELVFSGSKEEFVNGFRMAKGGREELTPELRSRAAGIRTFSTGFEALIRAQDAAAFSHLEIEPASIDEIVVFTSKEGETHA